MKYLFIPVVVRSGGRLLFNDSRGWILSRGLIEMPVKNEGGFSVSFHELDFSKQKGMGQL